MNNSKNSNSPKRKSLKDYYLQLPESSSPKTEFIVGIMYKTGVSFTTVRNWVIYGMRPKNHDHVLALCEATGLTEEELWGD